MMLRVERRAERLADLSARLAPALAAMLARAGTDLRKDRDRLASLSLRLEAAPAKRLADLARRLEQLDRTRASLGHAETLKRGFAIVRGDGRVVTGRAAAAAASTLEIEFHDGKLAVGASARKPRPGGDSGGQGSLF